MVTSTSLSTHVSLAAQALDLRIRLPRWVPTVPLPRILRALTPAYVSPKAAALPELGRALRIVEAICRRARIIPDTCLYKALTRYAMLRRSGYAATFVMGMDPRAREDLTAHAWVELDGVPYRETLDARMIVTYVYPDDRAAPGPS